MFALPAHTRMIDVGPGGVDGREERLGWDHVVGNDSFKIGTVRSESRRRLAIEYVVRSCVW